MRVSAPEIVTLVVTGVLGLAALAWQVISWLKAGPKVTAELGAGQIDGTGVLSVEFASGKRDIMTLPNPEGDHSKAKQVGQGFSPVNAIFVRNRGRIAVTLSRCHYTADLGGFGFRFEPQPAASSWGNHIPKRLEPGEDAVLVHDWVSMRMFLNRVLQDHEVEEALFVAVLTLGTGKGIRVSTGVQARADMAKQELLDKDGPRITREQLDSQATFTHRTFSLLRRPMRKD